LQHISCGKKHELLVNVNGLGGKERQLRRGRQKKGHVGLRRWLQHGTSGEQEKEMNRASARQQKKKLGEVLRGERITGEDERTESSSKKEGFMDSVESHCKTLDIGREFTKICGKKGSLRGKGKAEI